MGNISNLTWTITFDGASQTATLHTKCSAESIEAANAIYSPYQKIIEDGEDAIEKLNLLKNKLSDAISIGANSIEPKELAKFL